MTAKEIKRLASQRIIENAGSCISLTAFVYSLVVFFLLCEVLIFLGLRSVGYAEFYQLRIIFSNTSVLRFWVINLSVIFILMIPIFSMVRRLMLDISKGRDITDSRKYIATHAWSFYRKSFISSLILNFLRLFTAVPGVVGIYGIVHWTYVLRIDELTSIGLFCLTGSISLTCVWAILWVHYLISLSLTPLIMALNPRSNVFDACDLSVKVMDGRHGQYLMFMRAFLKYIPAMLLIYPLLIVFPYYLTSRIIFQLELLGERGQDKMPGMIKRWKKYNIEEAGK